MPRPVTVIIRFAEPATAIAEDLPLLTTKPNDFDGLLGLLTVVPVALALVPRERRLGPAAVFTADAAQTSTI